MPNSFPFPIDDSPLSSGWFKCALRRVWRGCRHVVDSGAEHATAPADSQQRTFLSARGFCVATTSVRRAPQLVGSLFFAALFDCPPRRLGGSRPHGLGQAGRRGDAAVASPTAGQRRSLSVAARHPPSSAHACTGLNRKTGLVCRVCNVPDKSGWLRAAPTLSSICPDERRGR